MSTKVEFPTADGYARGTDDSDRGIPPTPSSSDRGPDHGPTSVWRGARAARKRRQRFARLRAAILSAGLLIAVTCLGPTAGPAQPPQSGPGGPIPGGGHASLPSTLDDRRTNRGDNSTPLTPKQLQSLMQSNFDKSKRDATELAALAKQLREELDKPDVNPLSLEVTNRIERIQKLAKKIRDQMKCY